MDTAGCCCQWLLWTTVMLLLQHYQEVSGEPRQCPQGQLVHIQTRPHSIMCCFPIRCSVGEEVKPCTRNQTQDTCQKCEMHHNQSLRTSSYTMDRCIDWPLDWDCKNINNPDRQRNIQDDLTKRCMCNIEQGLMFYPPELEIPGGPMDSYCQRINEQCKAGFEPRVNGTCQPCHDNYFKSVEGYSLCEPKTNCHLLGLKVIFTSNATADNTCSQSEPMITKPFITQTSLSTPATLKTTAEVSRQSSSSVSTVSWHDEGVYVSTSQGSVVRRAEDKILWPIVGSLLTLVPILIGVGLVMYCCRRRRFLVCVYAAAKDCADAEDNHVQGCTYDSMDCQVKLPTANGSASSQNLIRGDRHISNGINGGVHFSIEDLPNGHVPTNIPHGDFNQVEYGHDDGMQSTNPLQYRSHVPLRPALRTGNKHVMFSQRQDNWPDLGQNMHQTPVDGFEANPGLGESDCLLISEHPHGTGAHQTVNPAGATSSPAVRHDGFSPMQILPVNDCRDTNFGHIGNNGPFLPPLRPRGHAVSVDGVTFTRSVSLIASPEGEIDEEERAALFPRFSQLLQEGDDSLSSDSTLVQNPACQQPATQRPADCPPLLAASVPKKEFCANQLDHSIMNLKEQDLVGSMHPTPSKPCPPSKLKPLADLTSTSTPTPAVPEEAQQTQLKTLGSSQVLSNSSESINTNINRATHPPEYLEYKQSDTDGISHNLAERKRQISGGVNSQVVSEKKYTEFQNCSDRKRAPSGGSNAQIILGHRTGDNHHQTPCIRTSSPEERNASRDKHQLNNRVVFFGNSENLHTGNKQPSPRTDLWQSARSQGSSEAASTNSKTLRSAFDPEKANTAQTSSDVEETEYNPDSQKTNISKTSSKTSVSSDLTDDGSGNPSASAVYRRSQSHNGPSISESPHKPPPRSMSEEKPQKLDRPVAKVKPMPASDSSVNQLPLDAPGETGHLPQALVCALPTSNHTAFNLSSSTEENDQEHMEMSCDHPSSTLEEDGQEADNEL